MDVLFLLLDDNTDIIDTVMTLILAEEESNHDEAVHHVEEEPPPAVWGGSRPGKAPNLISSRQDMTRDDSADKERSEVWIILRN